MDNLIYFKSNIWKVKRIGICNSFVSIGLDRKTKEDYIVVIPNGLYNKAIDKNWKAIYHYEYSKDNYEKQYLIFVEPKNNKRIKIEIKQVV